MFRYEHVTSTTKFTNVAEIVSLLKNIYKRNGPLILNSLPVKLGNWSFDGPLSEREAAEPFYFRLLLNLTSGMISSLANRPRSIYQYSSMAPRLSGKNCKFFKVLLSLNSQRRLRYKENNTKYRSLT